MPRISQNQLLKLRKRYKTDEDIGKLYGISRQAVHKLRKKYGMPPVKDKKRERDLEIARLYKTGHTGPRLAKKHGLSLSRIYRIIKKIKNEETKGHVPATGELMDTYNRE